MAQPSTRKPNLTGAQSDRQLGQTPTPVAPLNQLLPRALRRRAATACAVLGTALLLVTCTGEPVAPGAPRLGQVSIAPIWPEASRLGGLVLDNVRLTVVRLPVDTLARIARTFAPSTTQLQLTVPVLLLGPSENLQVTLELLSGTTLLFSGTQLISVGAGGGGSPIPIPVAFTGPGGQVAALTLSPRDTTISAGSQLAFTVTAQDSSQVLVSQFYTTWSSASSAVTIDGAGVATAGSSRATVTITAVTPSGARDSTTLSVVPAATQLVKISGDNQSASSLSPLPLPLVVEVRAADNLPVAAVTVSFAVLSGGGSVDSATATTDAQGRATSGATLGAGVGAQSFTATASGTNSVTFSATATSGGVRVWTGTVSTDWNTAGNWTPAAVPGAGDSVVVAAPVANDPTLTGNATIGALALQGARSGLTVAGNLTVARGIALPDTNSFVALSSGLLSAATIDLAGFQAFIDVSVAGGIAVSGATTVTGSRAFVDATGSGPNSFGPVSLSGSQAFLDQNGGSTGPITVSGASAFWDVAGTATVTGTPALQLTGNTSFAGTSMTQPSTVTFNGDVVIGGTAATLSPGAGLTRITVNGNLQTSGSGFLDQAFGSDTIVVTGNAIFGGGNESGRLTAGALFVRGNFTQTGLATSFVGSGSHTVFLNGAGAQTLNFASPGFAASRFQNVIVANSAGGVTATSDLYASGTAGVTPTAVRTLSGNGSTLFTTILNVSNFTFNNLLLNFAGSTVVTFDTVSFTGYAPTATPLTISHPGAVTPLSFLNVSFAVVPTSGFYLSATDTSPTDGVPLVIDMLNPSPLSGGSFVQKTGATVNWPVGSPVKAWTGASSTVWSDPGNWNPAGVPIFSDDVTIPAAPSSQPIVTTTANTQSVTIQSGATLTLNGSFTFNVFGDFDNSGTITLAAGAPTIDLRGTARTVRGGFPTAVSVSGSYSLTGTSTVTNALSISGGTGSLTVGGQFLTVNSLSVGSGGSLIETNVSDFVQVNGNVTMGGGDHTGKLTAGNLSVQGNFLQTSSGSPNSFAASGTHTTSLLGPGTVNFQSPGTAASRFLDMVVVGGQVTLLSRVVVGRDLAVSAAGVLALNGRTLEAGRNFDILGASSRLIMTNGLDSLLVGGDAGFAGDNELTFMSAGVLVVGANLSQFSTTSGDAFHPSGSHLTVLTGANPTLSFATPGDQPGTSHFQDLRWTGTGTLTLGSDVFAHNALQITATGATTIQGQVLALSLGGMVTGGGTVTFDNIELRLNMQAGGPLALNGLTFFNMDPLGTQLTVNHPGTGGPFTFTNLTFNTVPTTGRYLQITDTDGPSPDTLTVNMVNPNPATDGGFSQALNGAVITWPFAAPGVSWIGGTSTNWSTGANWSGGAVPLSTQDVTIPSGTTFSPVVTAGCTARSLTVDVGANLNVGAIGCLVQGDVLADGTITGTAAVDMQAAGNVRGNLQALTVSGPVMMSGPATLGGALIINGAAGSLTVNGQTLAVAQNLTLSQSGVLVMTNAADLVLVAGNATFGGGDETGQLTAGLLQVGGSLGQSALNSAASFAASGIHVTQLTGTSANLSLQSSGPGAGSSHLQELVWNGSGTLNLSSLTYVLGTFGVSNTGTVSGLSFTQSLHVGQLAHIGTLTFFNAQLWIETTVAVPVALSSLTFTNGSGITSLLIRHPGLPAGGKVMLDQITFTNVPSFPAVYLDVDDTAPADGNPLVVDVTNTTPSSPSGLVLRANGATINWPAVAPGKTWTGAVSIDWNNPGNWNPAQVPTAIDDVNLVPITNQPVLSSGVVVNNLTSAAGSILDLGTFVLVINGNADLAGTINGGVNSGVALVGTGAQLLRGTMNTTVQISGNYTLNGTLTIGGDLAVDGTLDLASFSGTVSGIFTTNGTGVLVMTNPGASLAIAGDAVFNGGSTTGLLTAGSLQIGGSFIQLSTTSLTSFAPSGSHKTVFSSVLSQAITFTSPGGGATGSHFQVLDLTGASGGVSLGGNTIADSVISTNTVAKLIGGGASLTMRRAQINGLTVDNAPLILDEQGVFSTENLSNITFQGFGPTGATVLTISGPGNSFAPRPAVTTTNVDFNPLGIGAGNFYVDLTSTNNQTFTITMTGSSQSPQIGGNGPALTKTNPGATVNWP